MTLIAACATALAGCGGGDPAPTGGDTGKLSVATTVAPITSIVAQVGGDRVAITAIVPSNSTRSRSLRASTPTTSLPKSGGKPNPHLWTHPRYALKYAEIVRDDLSRCVLGVASYFQSNYARVESKVAGFDRAMRASFGTIPRAGRKLLTYHDAYAYLARAARDRRQHAAGARDRHPPARAADRLRTAGREDRLELPGDRCAVRAHGAGQRSQAAVAGLRQRAAVGEILARLDIEHLRDRHIRELSGDQQQRVFIARAMLGEPELLLMDEPTSGVDIRLRHEILHLLDDLNARGLASC